MTHASLYSILASAIFQRIGHMLMPSQFERPFNRNIDMNTTNVLFKMNILRCSVVAMRATERAGPCVGSHVAAQIVRLPELLSTQSAVVHLTVGFRVGNYRGDQQAAFSLLASNWLAVSSHLSRSFGTARSSQHFWFAGSWCNTLKLFWSRLPRTYYTVTVHGGQFA